MAERVFYGVYVPPAMSQQLDGLLAQGLPGDHGYFATRSDLVRAALVRLQAEMSPPASATAAPQIRPRRKVQPVATAPGAAA